MSDLDLLRGMPLFSGLGDGQLGAVLAVTSRQRIPTGTVILSEGDRSNSLFVLASGSVEVTKRFGFAADSGWEGPKEKTLVKLVAPQFFGEMGLLEDTERSATVTALSDCELLEVTKADFERLAEADNNFAYRVVRNIAVVLASRLRRTDRDVLKLTMALSLALGNR